MSYKVEITAASVSELAGKLLALAATMQAVPTDPVMAEVKAAPKPRKSKPEVAEPPAGETVPSAEPTTVSTTSSETPVSEEPTPAPSTTSSASEPLDFDKDVAPVVLNAVKEKGKPWVQEILAQFGVERASQVAAEQLPELLVALTEGAA